MLPPALLVISLRQSAFNVTSLYPDVLHEEASSPEYSTIPESVPSHPAWNPLNASISPVSIDESKVPSSACNSGSSTFNYKKVI